MEPTAATGNPTYKNIKPVRSIGIMSLSPVTQTDGNKNLVSSLNIRKTIILFTWLNSRQPNETPRKAEYVHRPAE